MSFFICRDCFHREAFRKKLPVKICKKYGNCCSVTISVSTVQIDFFCRGRFREKLLLPITLPFEMRKKIRKPLFDVVTRSFFFSYSFFGS